MKQTIEKLWNGRLKPCDTCGENDPEIQHITELLERNKKALITELKPHQKELFEKYIDCTTEHCYLISAHAFSDGFALACRLISEAICNI